eukprot:4734781-Alexandrium_andersonii.AAC.1
MQNGAEHSREGLARRTLELCSASGQGRRITDYAPSADGRRMRRSNGLLDSGLFSDPGGCVPDQ